MSSIESAVAKKRCSKSISSNPINAATRLTNGDTLRPIKIIIFFLTKIQNQRPIKITQTNLNAT